MSSDAGARPPRRRHVLCCMLLLSAGVVVVVAGVIGLLALEGYPMGWRYNPIPFDERRMDEAVRWVQSHHPRGAGPIVVLPPHLASVSVTGRAYVTGPLVFVPTWVGDPYLYDPKHFAGNYLVGYVFSEKPLTPEMELLDMHVPAPCRPEDARQDADEGESRLLIGERVGKGRYWNVAAPVS